MLEFVISNTFLKRIQLAPVLVIIDRKLKYNIDIRNIPLFNSNTSSISERITIKGR